MPTGEYLVRCHGCWTQFTVGDCVKQLCPDCECKERGHHLWILGAGICGCCGKRMSADPKQDAGVRHR